VKHSRDQPCHKSNYDGPNNTHRVPPSVKRSLCLILKDSCKLEGGDDQRRSCSRRMGRGSEPFSAHSTSFS
jgi:hypothetical protein